MPELSDTPLYSTVREGLEQGFGVTAHDKWVLAEHVDAFPGLKDTEYENVVLLVTLSVDWASGSITETVTLQLLDSSYTELARYTEAKQAREIAKAQEKSTQ